MAPWKASRDSDRAVRAYAQRVGVAAFVSGTAASALMHPTPDTSAGGEYLLAGFTVGALLYTWWALRQVPRPPVLPPEPVDPADRAHFAAREAERERTIGHR